MTSSSSRWLALDILRGLSVIGMLLVVNPGAWEQHYSWLSHTEWAGICSADMIFPTFALVVIAAVNGR
jgi:predicted acyltransferase